MGDWVWYLGAGVLGVTGVVLFWWAWFGDRALGRARCGGCWYSLDALMSAAAGEGSVLAVCPECGWRGKRRGSYFRSRRRRGWAALAVPIVIGAAACGMTPKVHRDGVWSIVPTWAMWGVVRTGHVPSEEFAQEFSRRVVPNESFAATAERMYRWLPSLHLTRERGVRGVPVRARQVTAMWRGPPLTGFRFSPLVTGYNDADVESVQSHENWWTPGVPVFMPVHGSTPDVLVARVHCESGCWAVFTAKVPLAASIDEVMKPVTIQPSELLAAVKPTVFVLPTTRNLAVSVGEASSAEIGDRVALGIYVEVVRASGDVVARGRWYQSAARGGGDAMAGRPVLLRFGSYDPLRNVNGPMTCSLDELITEGCVVRFSTDEEMALSALECDKYWRGNFEVPLKDLVK